MGDGGREASLLWRSTLDSRPSTPRRKGRGAVGGAVSAVAVGSMKASPIVMSCGILLLVRIPTLYLDTSVLGGYFDDEWRQPTRELWRQMEGGLWRFVSSDVTTREMVDAPEWVRDLFAQTFNDLDALIKFDDEMAELAAAYIGQRVVTAKYEDDARHVAACTLARVDHLISWNFRHLVNVQRAAGFNGVNLLKGYPAVSIVNPLEIIYGNQDENL